MAYLLPLKLVEFTTIESIQILSSGIFALELLVFDCFRVFLAISQSSQNKSFSFTNSIGIPVLFLAVRCSDL